MNSLNSVPAFDDFDAFIAWRDEHFNAHPVMVWDKDFVLPTPAIESVADVVTTCITRNMSGRAWWAPTRHGKTRTIRYLMRKIREAFPGLAVIEVDACLMSTPSMLGMYSDLLKAARFHLTPSGRAAERRVQVENLLASRAMEGGWRRLVLFVDEAQNWGVPEWEWLKNIQNNLEKQGIALIVLSFGQEQLVQKIQAIVTEGTGHEDLRARFFRKLFRFNGLRTHAELKSMFDQFDRARFPNPNGPTFTQFAFPRAYAAGWRLASESESAAGYLKRAASNQYDLETVCMAIQHILVEVNEKDSSTFKVSDGDWKMAATIGLAEIDG